MGYENFYQQQRFNNYPNYNSQPQNMMAMGIKGRPVSSIEEARAMQIDFDGSLFIFPDIANKKIYTKQIGLDGIAVLNMYELKPIPTVTDGDYVTREEFNNAVEQIKGALSSKTAETVAEPQQFNF